MPGKEGGATLDAYWARVRHHPLMREISTYAEIKAAHVS